MIDQLLIRYYGIGLQFENSFYGVGRGHGLFKKIPAVINDWFELLPLTHHYTSIYILLSLQAGEFSYGQLWISLSQNDSVTGMHLVRSSWWQPMLPVH